MPTANDIRWFKQQFHTEIERALSGLPLDLDMIVAIACQETGHIWSVLRREQLPLDRIVALCVGDTIDAPRRSAFPKTKDALIAAPQGRRMFDIARNALEDMALHIPGFGAAVTNPNKFCHGFGVFQRDLQFFRQDPDYFLERRYESFASTLDHCLEELRRALRKRGFESRISLTDFEFATVAIVYNTGGFDPSRGLRQGFLSDGKFYGEHILDFVKLSRTVDIGVQLAPGRYVVNARGGLKLRGGPGTDFESQRTLPFGTALTVIDTDRQDPSWVRVDLEEDGVLDGFVFAPFLVPADANPVTGEHAPEPD